MIEFFPGVVSFSWRGRTVALLTSHYLIRWNKMGMMVSHRWRK